MLVEGKETTERRNLVACDFLIMRRADFLFRQRVCHILTLSRAVILPPPSHSLSPWLRLRSPRAQAQAGLKPRIWLGLACQATA
jgi:hypothetical protein